MAEGEDTLSDMQRPHPSTHTRKARERELGSSRRWFSLIVWAALLVAGAVIALAVMHWK
jgi:predicted lysophospholipase L1 biosynthesis ABC-type transport system permease subunit